MNMYTIGEFAKETGMSIRTLHYYDEIGLLQPFKNNAGHRQYNRGDLLTMQKIACFKLLGFPLETIKELLQQAQYGEDLLQALSFQQAGLREQKAKLENALSAIERVIKLLEHGESVENDTLASLIRSFQFEKEQIAWLEHHLPQESVSLFHMSSDKQEELDRQFVVFTQEVKRLFGRPPHDPEVQQLVQLQIEQSLTMIEQSGQEELHAQLAALGEEKLEELAGIASTPFTAEEEEWLQQAMDYFIQQHNWTLPGRS